MIVVIPREARSVLTAPTNFQRAAEPTKWT